jgi:hypothetical protein
MKPELRAKFGALNMRINKSYKLGLVESTRKCHSHGLPDSLLNSIPKIFGLLSDLITMAPRASACNQVPSWTAQFACPVNFKP